MTKAKVIAKGNKDQIEAEYIKLRIQSILDEFVLEDFLKEIEENNFKNEQEIKKMIEKEKNNSEDENVESFDGRVATVWLLFICIIALFFALSLT